MKRTHMISLLILFILIWCFTALVAPKNGNEDAILPAQNEKRKEEFFYEDTGDWDAMRLPLVYPYEILKLDQKLEINQKLGWSMKLYVPPEEKDLHYYTIHDVQGVSVENRIIMIYSSYSGGVDPWSGQKILYWFILVPDERIEKGFETKTEFLSFVKKYGIDQPNWMSPDMAYNRFVSTGCLEWIPGCN